MNDTKLLQSLILKNTLFLHLYMGIFSRDHLFGCCYGCDRDMTTWPFVSNDKLGADLLLIGTWLSILTDPPVRPTPVKAVSLGCATIEAPVRVSGILVPC